MVFFNPVPGLINFIHLTPDSSFLAIRGWMILIPDGIISAKHPRGQWLALCDSPLLLNDRRLPIPRCQTGLVDERDMGPRARSIALG